jgi:hypothetical protein
MAKTKKQPVNNEAVVEAPQQQEQLFTIKLEMVGAEEVVVKGLNNHSIQQIRQWFSGLGHSVFELVVGTGLLVFDRAKVAYLVIAPQEVSNDEGRAE